jgi:hypothetical protein
MNKQANTMSEEEKKLPEEKETQQVAPPRAAEKHSDDSTLSFDAARRKRKDELDPTKDTAVLSRNNPALRRAISAAGGDPDAPLNTTTLGDKQEVILLIRGMVERVVMEEGVIYKLGRFEIGTAAEDEIDLTPYGAMDRGVSRVHAQLHLAEGKVYITDLGSTNGTYITGNRLEANTPSVLRKGDELLLGRLAVQVLFR